MPSFHQSFCFCVTLPGLNTGAGIHVAVSRESNSRIVLPIRTRVYRPKLPVAPKPKKVVVAKADCQAKAQAAAISVESSAEVGPGPTTPAVFVEPTLVGLPMDASDTDMRQKVSRVQAEARLPRLVSGPKQKDCILEKYQAQYGNGKSIFTSLQGKHQKLNLQPPSQYHLIKSCSMKPDKNKSCR